MKRDQSAGQELSVAMSRPDFI